MDFEQAFSTANIQLEPRLQEYLNRKTFNRQNDIRPDIPEEQEFAITPEDKKIIRHYMAGKKIYSKRRTGATSHFVKPEFSGEDFFTDKDAFKKDPRYKRLQKKMASHKAAKAAIQNFEGIDEDYTIFHRTNPYDDPMNPGTERPSRIAKPYDDPSNFDPSEDLYSSRYSNEASVGIYNRSRADLERNDGVMMDSRDLVLGSSKGERNHAKYMYNPNDKRSNPRRSESSYNHRPRIAYRDTLIPHLPNGGLDHNHSVKDIIGNLDEYNRHLDDTYDYIEAEVDQTSHSVRPSTRAGSRREQYNGYRAIPYGYGGGLADVSVEDSLRGGIKDSPRRTTGFRNSFEHQFDYIDEDISDANHTVEMRPESTRGANKVVARPHSAAYRSDQRMRSQFDQDYDFERSSRSPSQRGDSYGYATADRDQDDYRRSQYRMN